MEFAAELPRPKIGGVWAGSIPSADFKATKTGDLVSVATGDSVTNRISGDAVARIRTWMAPSLSDTSSLAAGWFGSPEVVCP